MSYLMEKIRETRRSGGAPVIPFVPFPQHDWKTGVDHFLEVWDSSSPAAMGVVFPGRRVFRRPPGARGNAASAPPGAACAPPAAPVDWDVFRFCHALKSRSGMPLVLAVHYRDVVAFGIIPYAQESHKVGLDSLLIAGPALGDLDYLSSELGSANVGLSLVFDAAQPPSAWEAAAPYASRLAYFPPAPRGRPVPHCVLSRPVAVCFRGEPRGLGAPPETGKPSGPRAVPRSTHTAWILEGAWAIHDTEARTRLSEAIVELGRTPV